MRIPSLLALLGSAALAAEPLPPLPRTAPLSPEDAGRSFHVLHGFQMELLAAEPLVTDPVAMAYDEDGRAYVCEMNDYPYTDKAHHKASQENPTDQPIGRVRLLADTDGDGKFDRSTVFAEGLSWPTGVACWKGGVFVAATPDLWYFKDTDGDGVADVRQKIFTGFKKLNVQAVMNNLVWGLDNRIYGAGGTNGGTLRSGGPEPIAKAAPNGTLTFLRNDFAFDPNAPAKSFALESGGARFGNTFDDWGNRFLCNIRNPIQHVVLPAVYMRLHPSVPVHSPLEDVAAAGDQLPVYRLSPVEPWRDVRAKRWAGERDMVMPRSELVGAGVVTSSSGVTVYRGSAYPAEFYGNVFTAESAGNLFYRQKLTPKGVTFTAERVDGNQEMVASTDLWFRPVNFVNAPDGTLHVCDMYREVIEHPWSIPGDIHAALDLESGRDKGRLWRLAPPGFKAPKPPHLSTATTAELVALLENPNSWWRETAQRLLFERQDSSAVPLLRRLIANGQTPLGRLHALWTLRGLVPLTREDLAAAEKDPLPQMRAQAVAAAESAFPGSAGLAAWQLTRDADPRVRFRALLAVSVNVRQDHLSEGVIETLRRDHDDPWLTTAALMAGESHAGEVLRKISNDGAVPGELLRIVAAQLGARTPDELLIELKALPPDARLVEIALGLGEGLKRRRMDLRAVKLDALLEKARREAQDTAILPANRKQAIELLTYDRFDLVRDTLLSLLAPREPHEVQAAALQALAGFSAPEVGPLLLSRFNSCAPALRTDLITAMLGVKNRLEPLLTAVEKGQIPRNQIPPARRTLLLKNPDPAIRARVEKLYANAASSRREVIEKYQAALSLKGDAARGRQVYETNCQVCHRLGEKGNDIGPHLGSVKQWSGEQLLTNILDPNREVAPNYLQYAFELTSGETVVGLLVDETPSGLTLRRPDAATQTILRRDLKTMAGLGVSLMPEGLEANLTPQQMADLIAAIKE